MRRCCSCRRTGSDGGGGGRGRAPGRTTGGVDDAGLAGQERRLPHPRASRPGTLHPASDLPCCFEWRFQPRCRPAWSCSSATSSTGTARRDLELAGLSEEELIPGPAVGRSPPGWSRSRLGRATLAELGLRRRGGGRHAAGRRDADGGWRIPRRRAPGWPTTAPRRRGPGAHRRAELADRAGSAAGCPRPRPRRPRPAAAPPAPGGHAVRRAVGDRPGADRRQHRRINRSALRVAGQHEPPRRPHRGTDDEAGVVGGRWATAAATWSTRATRRAGATASPPQSRPPPPAPARRGTARSVAWPPSRRDCVDPDAVRAY